MSTAQLETTYSRGALPSDATLAMLRPILRVVCLLGQNAGVPDDELDAAANGGE
mgnify:CR=1 FL=1